MRGIVGLLGFPDIGKLNGGWLVQDLTLEGGDWTRLIQVFIANASKMFLGCVSVLVRLQGNPDELGNLRHYCGVIEIMVGEKRCRRSNW